MKRKQRLNIGDIVVNPTEPSDPAIVLFIDKKEQFKSKNWRVYGLWWEDVSGFFDWDHYISLKKVKL